MSELKVLVPLDGSELAEAALEYVRLLAWRLQDSGEDATTFHGRLLAVVESGALLELRDAADVEARQAHLLQEYLRAKQQQLVEAQVAVETSVRRGSPANEIATEAAEFHADLIVLSTHGRSGSLRWKIGSVADKVIRLGPCDVLAIGPRSARPGLTAIRSILIPLDGSALAEEAVPRAKTLAALFGAKLHLLRVVPPEPIFADDGPGLDFDAHDALLKGAAAYLEEVRDRLDVPEAVSAPPLAGPVADRILEFVASNSIDLVVMTTHGRGGLLPAMLGSVTDRLLAGPAPIVVVQSTRSRK